MKTVLLLGGPAAGQRVEVHGTMRTVFGKVTETHSVLYEVVPLCSHGEVHWFGVLDGADPLALLIAGYGASVAQPEHAPNKEPALVEIASATKVVFDEYGRSHVVPDPEAARRLMCEGFVRIGPDTFRRETYK